MSVTIAPKAPPAAPRSDRETPRRDPAAPTGRPPQLLGADALRALAALAVIVVHSAHWPPQDTGADAAVWYSVTLLARFCVPAFVLLTGLVLAYRYAGRPLGGEFLLRRARRSLVPWLVWAPLMCLAGLWFTGDLDMSWGAVRDWWAGGGGHLYFLVLVPQFYLLMLLWPTRRRPAMWAAGVAVALQLALDTVRLYLPVPGAAAHQAMLAHGFELFPFWIGYFAVGVAAGTLLAERRGRGLSAWPFIAVVPVATAALLLADVRGAVNAQYGDGTGAFLRPILVPLALAVCGAVVFGAPALLRRLPRTRAAVSLFSKHSLGVYILHPLVLTLLGRALFWPLHLHLPWSILPWLAATAGTAVLALLLTRALAYTPLAMTLGEERMHLRPRRRGPEPEVTLPGRAAQRSASPQRRSTSAISASPRSPSGGAGASSVRST